MARNPVEKRELPDLSRLDSRSYRWFCLRVPPQKELTASRILTDAGFATFVPTGYKWEFRNRANRGRYRKQTVERPIMPGYLFLGMGDGTPGWGRVFAFRVVLGVVGINGVPMPVPHDMHRSHDGQVRPGLRDLIWRARGGEFDAPDYQRWQETRGTFKPGDSVEADLEGEHSGALVGKVIEIHDREARVVLDILGAPREVTVDTTRLRRS